MPIIGSLPYKIQNGDSVDAIPVMADFNFIVAQINANAPVVTNITPTGFTRAVGAALSTAGFAQFDFQQAILYGVPSSELSSPPRHITIERVTADNLEDYLSTMADGFEMPTEWRDAVVDDGRRRFRGDEQWFLARVDAEPAAVATLRVRDGVASLGGGATVPGHRRKVGCARWGSCFHRRRRRSPTTSARNSRATCSSSRGG